MWRGRRRLRRLEDEMLAAQADHAELRQRVELFEKIAEAAGAALDSVPASPMPPELVAAAREVHAGEVPVRFEVAGTQAIAVIGGEGDPREWWTAIWRLTESAEYET
jgi:hypothetical protein